MSAASTPINDDPSPVLPVLIRPGNRAGTERDTYLQNKALGLAARLQLPYRPVVMQVTELISQLLGVAVHVTLADAPVPGATARTFRMNNGEYVIVVQRATTEIHRLHNVFHETAHLLLGTLHTIDHTIELPKTKPAVAHPSVRFLPAGIPERAARAQAARRAMQQVLRGERDAEIVARTLTAHGLALSQIRFISDIDSKTADIDAMWTTSTWTL